MSTLSNFLHGLFGGAQQQQPAMIRDQNGQLVPMGSADQSAGKGGAPAPSQNALRDLPGGWLNIFSAVRNYNLAREQATNDEAMRANEQQRLKLASRGDQREQDQIDQSRSTQLTQGALGAYSNMVDTIDQNPNITEADRPTAYAAAFDRILPALQASGFDTDRLNALRDQVIQNPHDAGDILAGLQGAGSQGSQPSLQAAIDENGNAVFLDPRTRRPVAHGYAPASAVAAQGRLAVAQGNLEQRKGESDVDYQRRVSAARAAGRAEGTAEVNAPQAMAAIDTQLSGVNNAVATLDATEHYLSTQPETDNVLTTNARIAASHVPGTPEADYAANLEQLKHSLSLYDLRSLRQSGLTLGRTNLAEFQAASQAVANLSLRQTVTAQRRAVAAVRNYLTHVQQSLTDERAHAQSLVDQNNNGGGTSPPPPPPAPPPPPSNDPRARRPGETTDQYLSRLHL